MATGQQLHNYVYFLKVFSILGIVSGILYYFLGVLDKKSDNMTFLKGIVVGITSFSLQGLLIYPIVASVVFGGMMLYFIFFG